jgi:hypothetical protein
MENNTRVINSKFDLEKQLFIAQQEWIEDEQLEGLREQIDTLDQQIAQNEYNIALDSAKLAKEDWLRSKKIFNDLLNNLTTHQKEKLEKKWFTPDAERLSKQLWYIVDENWKPLMLDKDWNTIAYKDDIDPVSVKITNFKDWNWNTLIYKNWVLDNVIWIDWKVVEWEDFTNILPIKPTEEQRKRYQYISAKADDLGNIIQPSWVYDPDTWEFYVGKSFWGNSNQSEFRSDPKTNKFSWIAEYTNIYKGSPSNRNWLDLAGKKWSAIKSNVSWEVIFAWDSWAWGNQVRIRDEDWNVHQFSHLDWINVNEWDQINPWLLLWLMGNTGNVLKGDWTKPTPEELAAGRWTHVDYTVYDSDWKPYTVEEAMSFAGIGSRRKAREW